MPATRTVLLGQQNVSKQEIQSQSQRFQQATAEHVPQSHFPLLL